MPFLLRIAFAFAMYCAAACPAIAQPAVKAPLSWSTPLRLDIDRSLYDHCLVLHNDTLYGVSLTYGDSLRANGLVAHRNLETFYATEEPVINTDNAHTRCWIEPPRTLFVVWLKEDDIEDPGEYLYARGFDFERETWTPLEQVYGGDEGYGNIFWYGHSTSILHPEEGGAVVAFSHEGRMQLLSHQEDEWQVKTTELKATYIAADYAPNGRICQGFIAFAREYITSPPSTRKPSVLFMCSNNDGTLWKEPVLVNLSGDNQRASKLRIAVSPQGRIHLLWAMKLNQGGDFFRDDEFWHAYSDDGGRHWSAPNRIPIPEDIWLRSSEKLLALPSGALYFAFDGVHREAEPAHLTTRVYHMWWAGTEWTGPHPLPLRAWSQDPEIVLDASGRLLLLWTQHAPRLLLQQPASAWATRGPGTFYTILEAH